MLVISRKEGEALFVGDDIRIVVVRIEEDKIRLGIEAPRDVVILREEHLERSE